MKKSEMTSQLSLTPSTSRSVSQQSCLGEVTKSEENTTGNYLKESTGVLDGGIVEDNPTEKLENDGINGSKDSVYSASTSVKSGRRRRPKIVMGKQALIRDQQRSQSNVIHHLVNDKYEDQLTNCINRIYHRRVSRDSRSTDDDGASSNYSAGSLRTINTPEDLYDGRSYFSLLFPTKSENEFDFLQSTDELNRDTTIEDTFLNSTVISTDLDYDPKKFLKNALGDASFETRSLDAGIYNSNLYSSGDAEPKNMSSILSKAGSLYSSVRKSIRRVCSTKDKNGDGKNKSRGKNRCQSFSPGVDSLAENFVRDLYVQNGIIFQASKALSFCKNSGDFSSPECIEAEKILLVATCTKEAIQYVVDNGDYCEKNIYNDMLSGSLELSDVVYYLRGDIVTEIGTKRDFVEHFVVVIHSGKTVLSSKVLKADKNGEVRADKKFVFNGLKTNFEISVAIYCMKVAHLEIEDNQKSQQKKNRKSKVCPSPRSFFRLHNNSSGRSLLSDGGFSIKPSSFTLWGTCTIRCPDREKTHFRMHHVPLCSSLEGYFTAFLKTSVELNNKLSGFLTIGIEEKTHLVWNRRWCVMEGSTIKYWNYPSEESSSEPIGVIHLDKAQDEAILADRSLCPRPKTLFLKIQSNGDVLKYFLSADTVEEKQTWFGTINFVISTLKSWGKLKL